MRSKKYHLVINIAPNTFYCHITPWLASDCIFEQKNNIQFDVGQLKIEEMINQLFDSINQRFPDVKKSQFVVDIHIDPMNVQHKILALPETKLLASEIPLWVKASIYKLFEVSTDDVLFDYAHHATNKNHLYVAICKRRDIDKLVALFRQLNISVQFIGLLIDGNIKFNFLPWRLAQQRKRNIGLLIMLIVYANIWLITLGLLWWREKDQLYQYQALVNKQALIEQSLLEEQPKKSRYYEKNQQQLHQFLLMFSNNIPASITLDSLNYSQLGVNITGKAFSYIDITEFSNVLNQEKQIQENKITAVRLEKNGLLFQMEMRLYEQ